MRFQRIAYNSVAYTHEIAAARNNSSAWNIIINWLNLNPSLTSLLIIAGIKGCLNSGGFSTVGGYTSEQIGNAIARLAGSTVSIASISQLTSDTVNWSYNSALNTANSSSLTFVHIYFLTSYHGSWYSYTTAEAGWTGNKVYLPSSFYGTGNFCSN